MFGSVPADRVLSGLSDLYALGPVEAFPALALRVSRGLICCDEASFNEIDLQAGTFRALVDPPDKTLESAAHVFGQFQHEHPVLAHLARRPDSDVHAISDFVTVRQFRRLGIYGEFFGPLGIEDQISVSMLISPGRQVIGLAMDRSRSFDDSERDMLTALRPHLVRAYRNALLFTDALATGNGQPEAARDAATRLARLTDRQHEVLALIADGQTNAQVAHALSISEGTVKKHVENLLERMQTSSRIGAARLYLSALPDRPSKQWWIVDGSSGEQWDRVTVGPS